MKINKSTVIRSIVLFIALLNIILEMFGLKVLPIDNELVSNAVSVVFLIASTVSAWWKNNSFTEKAVKADEYLRELKGGK